MEKTLGFSNFLSELDYVGMGVLIFLFVLSVASWYLILVKGISNRITSRRANKFLKHFWSIDSLPQLKREIGNTPTDNAFVQLAKIALAVNDNSHKHGLEKLAAAGGVNELLTRSLRNGLDQEAAHVESGLTVLASAGSASPFIGLFGTVWGIYHALIQIGITGQGTLDKVAGPVGEALIMTALGLAVAIPAVLAYNAFIRRNRVWLAQLDSFAHDLYAILTVGSKMDEVSDNQKQPHANTAEATSTSPIVAPTVDLTTGVAVREG